MLILLTIVHVIVCLFLIIVVLLQSGKAADLAGAFGGMGSQTAFGPRGAATVLSKATTIAAGLFMVTSLSLSVLATRSGGGAATVLDSAKTAKKPETKAPAAEQKGGAPQMMVYPEGGDPSKAVSVPIPMPEGAKQGAAGTTTTTVPVPAPVGGAKKDGAAPAEKK